MDLFTYVKRNYKNPNISILKTLKASEQLIEYLFKTPYNTNMVIVAQLIGSGGGGGTDAVVGTAIVGQATI